MEPSTVRLRALRGTPLADTKVRSTVVSSAHAIAERTGVTLLGVDADEQGVTVTLMADKLAALGFLTELRRLTDQWFSKKHGGQSLWGRTEDQG